MSVFGLYLSGQWAQDFTSRDKDPCLDFWAQDFTQKIEVKMRAFEVKIRAYEVRSCAYEVKSLAHKSRHGSLPHEVKSWAHWAEGYDPQNLMVIF